MRRDRIGPPCRGSGRRTSPSCAPVHPFCHPLRARGPGRGLPAATGSLANAIGRAKTAEGLGRAFSPAFRARAWVPKNLARRVLIYWFRRRDAARPDRAAMPRIGPANLSIVRPRSPLLSPSTRARARPWSARCYGVARQRDRSRQNSRGPRACFLSGISGSRVGAEESGAASFDLLVSAARCGASGSGRYAADRAGEPLHRAPPVHPFCHPLRARGSGRGLPAATGSLANAIGRAKTAEAPRSPLLSPSTRARARPWSARCYGVARQRDRSRQNSRGPLTPSVTLYAREGQAVVCPLLRGRSPTRSVAPKQPRASGVLSLRHFGLARGCR